jgi:hypothetical protein
VEVHGTGGEHSYPASHQRVLWVDRDASKLYLYLDALKERAIYCDADSVFYIQQYGEFLAQTCEDRFGDMTSYWGFENFGKQ